MSAKAISKKILVVEDTENVADLMREMLHSFGYEVEVRLAVTENGFCKVASTGSGRAAPSVMEYAEPVISRMSWPGDCCRSR